MTKSTRVHRKGPAPKHTDEQYLAFDPGAGDDFPAEVEARKTSLVVTRKEHTCFGWKKNMQHKIPAGTRVFRELDAFEDVIQRALRNEYTDPCPGCRYYAVAEDRNGGYLPLPVMFLSPEEVALALIKMSPLLSDTCKYHICVQEPDDRMKQ